MSTLNSKTPVIALAGQPNCGKSTLFNLLTGARQFVANYPGVTVDKMYGSFSIEDQKISLVDLPGTYAFTSYSKEEMAARDFILNDNPDIIVAVVDASTLDKGLYFVLQLLEMGVPVIVALNMIDVAHGRGMYPDVEYLSNTLNVPFVPLQATKKSSQDALCEVIKKTLESKKNPNKYEPQYNELSPYIARLGSKIQQGSYPYPAPWLALKLFEDDPAVMEIIEKDEKNGEEIKSYLHALKNEVEEAFSKTPLELLVYERHTLARKVFKDAVKVEDETKEHTYAPTFTDKVDAILCHRILGPICLFAILFIFYQVSVTFGNYLAGVVWPVWGALEVFCVNMLPVEGFLFDPLVTSFGSWLIKSLTTIMNYLPIFFLMFAFVAILEDSGYLARIAFVLDKIFSIFGLHGQSTLPLIIGGIYVGGCAIPGVVATRAIPDERARFATIMIVPMMNCLAKVPLYLLLITVFFAETAGSAMFFMGTITLMVALIVSKFLSLTLLKGHPSSPFLIELPSYHMPAPRNVITESCRRVVIFIKKIFTIVLTVSSFVFLLIFYPNVPQDRIDFYINEQTNIENNFINTVNETEYADMVKPEDILYFINYQTTLRNMKMGKSEAESEAIDARELEVNPIAANIALRSNDAGRTLFTALRRVDTQRKNLRRDYSTERFEGSYLGRAGKALEPITAGAGFNWRINVALLSALAAKENSAATLGALYGIDGSTTAESFAEMESSFTPLHALALMLFMAFYPPCLATAMMVRQQTHSTKWMAFAVLFQICLGLFIATLVFSGGTALGFTGTQTMWSFYALVFTILVLVGLIPNKMEDYSLNKVT